MIPLAARIIAVSDTLDALSSDRSYRSGVGADRALDEIAQAAGGHFDPEIVAAISPRSLRSAMRLAQAEMP